MDVSLRATQEYLELYTGRNGNNDAWFEKLKNKLLHAGCFCITGEDYVAPPSDAATVHGVARHEHHLRRVEKFTAIVNEACGIELRDSIIGDEQDPRVIWRNLAEFRNSTRESNPLVIRQKLHGLKMGSSTAQIFVHNAMALRKDIMRSGGAVSDQEMIAILLNGIPHTLITDDFHNLFCRIKQKMIDDPGSCNLSYVVSSILERDAEVQAINESNGEASSEAAMLMKSHSGKKGGKSYDPLQCWHCEERGHHRKQCTEYLYHLKSEQRRINKLLEEVEANDSATRPQQEQLNTVFTDFDYGDSIADTSAEEVKEESEDVFYDAVQTDDAKTELEMLASDIHFDTEAEADIVTEWAQMVDQNNDLDHPFQGW